MTNVPESVLGDGAFVSDNHVLPEVDHFVTGIMIFGFLWRVFLSVEKKKYTVIKFFSIKEMLVAVNSRIIMTLCGRVTKCGIGGTCI